MRKCTARVFSKTQKVDNVITSITNITILQQILDPIKMSIRNNFH